jgi:hypothetical protein
MGKHEKDIKLTPGPFDKTTAEKNIVKTVSKILKPFQKK